MTTAVTSSPAPAQGHCSRCGKIWTLEQERGVCPWCGSLTTCQTSRRPPRSIKSSSRRSRKQALVHSNGYDHLEGEWLTYYKVASRFAHKAKAEDTQDLFHDIILTLAVAERNNGHKPFTEAAMYRIASYTQADYWRTQYKLNNGLTCCSCSKAQRQKCKEDWSYTDCPKAINLDSLNKPVIDGEGNTTELGELIADDKALDLDAWLDARTFLIGAPQRLKGIAVKLRDGIPLDGKDQDYLDHLRKRERKKLF